jgi:hypothetical protein
MTNPISITLPGGVWRGEALCRDATVRAMTGADEEFLAACGRLLPAERTTALLTRCMVALGERSPVSVDDVRSLTVGDREALLLWIRRLTLGDRIESVVSCPAASCGEAIDVSISVGDLLLPPYDQPGPWFEASVEEGGSQKRVRFRAVNGADQEEAARAAQAGVETAGDLLARRCVQGLSGEESVTPELRQALSRLLTEVDPQAEITLHITCPACDHRFAVLLDAGSYLGSEALARSTSLFREVHLLAFHYHWSEADIFAMTPSRRRRYLDLLAEQFEAERS